MIPPDYQPPESVYTWAEGKGWPRGIVDYYLVPFREYFVASGKRHKRWDLALMRWIRTSSPRAMGRMTPEWEAALNHAQRQHKAAPGLIEEAKKVAARKRTTGPPGGGDQGRRTWDATPAPTLPRHSSEDLLDMTMRAVKQKHWREVLGE